MMDTPPLRAMFLLSMNQFKYQPKSAKLSLELLSFLEKCVRPAALVLFFDNLSQWEQG